MTEVRRERNKNGMPEFKFLEHDKKATFGYQHSDCHVIFYVIRDFTRTAQSLAVDIWQTHLHYLHILLLYHKRVSGLLHSSSI